MSVEDLQRAAASTRAVLAGVRKEQLGQPTPCEGWDVRALVNHIVGGQWFFAAGARGERPGEEQDFCDGDLVAAFDQAAAASIEAFNAEGVLERTLELPFGQMPGAVFLQLAVTDTFQHGWDLARATGQPTDLDPELATALLATVRIPDQFRTGEGAPFGPEREAPAGAPAADRLAALLGRAV